MTEERALLAGGCFWGVQDLFRRRIFDTGDKQRRIAEGTIADVDASGLWPGKVVSEVVPAGDFWEAEPEHQDYLRRDPGGYTCNFVRPDWRLPIRKSKGTKLGVIRPETPAPATERHTSTGMPR